MAYRLIVNEKIIFSFTIEAHFQEVKHMSKEIVPVAEKYLLTINEAASYFNIGAKKMRRLAEEYTGEFSLYSGNILLIIRTKF